MLRKRVEVGPNSDSEVKSIRLADFHNFKEPAILIETAREKTYSLCNQSEASTMTIMTGRI